MQIPHVPNGCAAHTDCFTCPFEDCIVITGKPRRNNTAIYERHKREAARAKRRATYAARIELVITMFKAGESQRKIAKTVHISVNTVRNWIDRYLVAGEPIPYPQPTKPIPSRLSSSQVLQRRQVVFSTF